jgi:putative tricarboxylic transport membrane protein
MMKNNDQRSSLVWLAVGIAIALYSLKYDLGSLASPGPGFLPLLTGVAVAGLALVVFFQQLPKEKGEKLKGLWKEKNWLSVMMVMGALVLYAVLFKFLGFILDTLLLTAFLLRVMEPMGWKKVLAWSLGASLGSYAIFELWLQAQLPTGFLGF